MSDNQSTNRIKELREQNGLSIAELSEQLKIPYQTLRNYEIGKRNPRNKKTWEQLANYFDVSIAYMMGLSDSKTSVNNIGKEINIHTEEIKKDNFKNPKNEEKFWNLIDKMYEIEEKDAPLRPDIVKEINFNKLAPNSDHLLSRYQSLDRNNQEKILDYLHLLLKSQDFDELLNSLDETKNKE